MKRKVILLIALLVAISAGIAPVSIAIWLAYRATVENAEANLNAIAQGIADDTSKILRDVDRGLIALADVSFACTPADISVMNTMAYDIPEISEIGLLRPDRKLVCTSWGAIDPPVKPDIPPAPPGFSLIGPMEIKLMKRFGLIAMRKREDGSEIGALLHPSILIGRLGADLGKHGFAVLLRREDTHLYAWKGNVPEMEMVESETEGGNGATRLRALFKDGIERTLSAVELEGYPGIYSVTAVSDAWILNDWKRMAFILGAIGAGTSIVLLILVAGILRRRLSLQGELESSLQKDEFEINYQPVIDLKSGCCVGAEALISWVQPGGKRVRPDLFIPLAEDTGLIEPLTEWLMKTLRHEMEDLLGSNRSYHIAINLSPCHFESDRILETSGHYFRNSKILPSQIIYEITERGLIEENKGVAREVMTKLRARQSHIAVDDFGTGYSSLGYISSFPLDYLKIDKRFVDAIGTDAPMAGLVDSIIDMAKRLELRIIAEGVETSEQADYLKQRGVDYVQGWYYAKAIPAAEFIAFVQEFNRPRMQEATS
ncbi:MAG: EAL domain-containing protein [Gammaproteobacteria bacterium]|jgi:sensor c-di-GMP phosphodiesterase-like protein